MKPLIFKRGSSWWCADKKTWGIGKTPVEAFDNWLKESKSRLYYIMVSKQGELPFIH